MGCLSLKVLKAHEPGECGMVGTQVEIFVIRGTSVLMVASTFSPGDAVVSLCLVQCLTVAGYYPPSLHSIDQNPALRCACTQTQTL